MAKYAKTIDIISIFLFLIASLYCLMIQNWTWSILWIASSIITYVVMKIDPAPKVSKWLLSKIGRKK